MLKPVLSRSTIRIFVLVILAIVVAMLVILLSSANSKLIPLKTNRQFTQEQLGTTYHLHDLGVADINNDRHLDIYTVNHSARQSLLVNNGHGKFTDQLVDMGLSQNSQFPGLEPSDQEPQLDTPGIYIYWDQAKLVIRTQNLSDFGSATGQIQLPKSVKVEKKGNLQFTTHDSGKKLTVNFIAKSNSQLTIKSRRYFFSPLLKLDDNFPLERVYVGSQQIQPDSHEFAVRPGRDRHGMAWADYNGDNQTDVFIIRGGGGGRMKPNALRNNDELLIKENSQFKDYVAESGIVKDVCPGRRVSLVDFDSDGKLDIYVGCGRGKPPRQLYPNQLHRQKTEGQFVDVATERGLDIPQDSPFVWLDADNDRDSDLFWADSQTFRLYVNQSGYFESQAIGESSGQTSQITVSDYDADGDLDIFVASTEGNALLTNLDGMYEVTEPQSVGLPIMSYAANWVDYDNDGLMDLHVLPDGIYRQSSNRKFEATQLLGSDSSKLDTNVFCTWFDADNDGDRDLLIAMPTGDRPSLGKRIWQRVFPRDNDIFRLTKSKLMLYRNRSHQNHWLEIDLIGDRGNHQGIGTQVEVLTLTGVYRQQIGQFEGSLRSQGHYRLYFGLGQQQDINAVKIFWSDGHVQEITNPASDRLLTIKQVSKVS